jgi:hypothetical protein
MIIGARELIKNPNALLKPIPLPFNSGFISSITFKSNVLPAGSNKAIPIPIKEVIIKKKIKLLTNSEKKNVKPNKITIA